MTTLPRAAEAQRASMPGAPIYNVERPHEALGHGGAGESLSAEPATDAGAADGAGVR